MMTEMTKTGKVAKAICDYLGIRPEALVSVQCHPDPVVAGTYAFRALVERLDGQAETRPYDFLTIGVPLGKLTDEDLEECDWETWPPKSAGRPTSWVVS